VLATALGLPEDYFRERAQRSPHTCDINRYPALSETGAALAGQNRVAPHTDWAMLTILDRQPGYGGLQVQTRRAGGPTPRTSRARSPSTSRTHSPAGPATAGGPPGTGSFLPRRPARSWSA